MSRTVRFIKNGFYFDHSPEFLIAKDLHKFKGWSCSAGVNGLFIDWQGDVYPGTCLISKINSLGTIETDFTLPKEWLICKKNVCHCNIEITLPKFNPTTFKLDTSMPIPFDEHIKSNTEIETADVIAPAYHFDQKTKYVMWALGRRCNYSCSYCDDNAHSKTDPFFKRNDLFKTVNKLQAEYAKNQNIRYTFTGGEPTLHPDFLDLVKHIHSMGNHIGVTSNGSRLESYYVELIQYANLQFSLHFEFLNVDKIIKIIQALCIEKQKNPAVENCWLEVRFMIPPGGFDKAMNLLLEFKKIQDFEKYYHYSFVPVRDPNSIYLMKYDDLELKKIQQIMSDK